MFLRGEYNENSDFFNVNEGNVGSSPNLEDMHQREALPIGCEQLAWKGMRSSRS